jgi:type I restriction enzyme S subunit
MVNHLGNWKNGELGDFVTLKRGFDLPQQKREDGQVPIFSSSGITGTHSTAMVKAPGVITGRYGTIGEVFYAAKDFWPLNTTLFVEDFHGNDAKFIYYFLKTLEWSKFTSASAVPGINRNTVHKEIASLPDVETQRRIASTLSMFDEKIKINTEINDNLQQQAMSLYAEMFLNSSDSNVTSGTLSDIAVITMGQSPSGSSYNEDGVGEVFYQGRAEFGFRFPKRRLFTTEPKRMAEAGDVLLSVRAPVGDLNIAYERCCIGRGLGAIHSKTDHSSFVLYTMFALRSQLDVFNGEGTVFGSINRDALNAIPIDIPPVTEIDQFEVVAHPIDELIRANYEENCRLEAIRDSLLPKLMSGEIDVSAVQL